MSEVTFVLHIDGERVSSGTTVKPLIEDLDSYARGDGFSEATIKIEAPELCHKCHTRIIFDEVNEVWRSTFGSRACYAGGPRHEP